MLDYFDKDNFAPAQSNVSVELTRAFFVAVPSENPLHYRPMVMTFDEALQVRLQNVTEGGLNINHAAISEIARDIIHPSEQSRGTIGISGSWDNQRFAVFLEFEIRTPTAVIHEVITGYTDHLGYSAMMGDTNISWDPGMFIHVNAHMRINYQKTYGRNGAIVMPRAVSPNQILRPISVQNGMSQMGNTTAAIGLRPADSLYGVQRNLTGSAGHVNDTRSSLDSVTHDLGVASARNNEIPSKYIETVLKSFSQAHNENTDYNQPAWTYGTAASYAKEEQLDTSILLRRLSEGTGYATTGCFTMGELIRNWHYAADVIETVLPRPGAITSKVDSTNNWGGYTVETQVAHAMAHAIPATMTSCLMVACEFTATNMTIDGSIQVAMVNAQMMFPNENDAVLANNFINTLQNTILPEILSKHGSFDIGMQCSLFGTSDINIALDGYASERFSAPNYCDALSAATIAADSQELELHAANTQGLLESVFTDNQSLGLYTR